MAFSNGTHGKDDACDAIAEPSGRGWLVSREEPTLFAITVLGQQS